MPNNADLTNTKIDKNRPIYAGFFIRFLATAIDYLILGTVIYILELIIYPGFQQDLILFSNHLKTDIALNFQSMYPTIYSNIRWWLFITICYYLLTVVIFWYKIGGTPGKLLLGLRVVDKDMNLLSINQCILRYLSYIISMVPLGMGYIIIAFHHQKRGLHDLIAESYVVVYSKSKQEQKQGRG